MLKFVCALFLLISTGQYVGPVTPGFAHCVDGVEQNAGDEDCRDNCAFCICTIDRPTTIGLAPVGLRLAPGSPRLRPLAQAVPPSPPGAEILHVPRSIARA